MNWKKIIAREWLYIVTFAAGSLILSLGASLSFKSDYVEVPGLKPELDFSPFYDSNVPLLHSIPTATLKEAVATYDSAITVWEGNKQERNQYNESSELIEKLSILILVCPYPLFLFIRTIRWSIKQVRKKPSQLEEITEGKK